jgi:hypothetical protein
MTLSDVTHQTERSTSDDNGFRFSGSSVIGMSGLFFDGGMSLGDRGVG